MSVEFRVDVTHLFRSHLTPSKHEMWIVNSTKKGITSGSVLNEKRVKHARKPTRTFLRPRDAILFVNECLARGADRQQITVQMVTDAEASYSEKRFFSLVEEWAGVYPKLAKYLNVLVRRPPSFPASEFSKSQLEDWVMGSLIEDMQFADPVAQAAKVLYIDGRGSDFDFTLALIDALYVVGAIGVKPDSHLPCYWSFYSDHRPASGSITPASSLQVHPAFWRALAISLQSSGKGNR